MKTKGNTNIKALVLSAMLGALAFALMFVDFSVPFMPSFIKMDVSDLPALIGAVTMGPVSGVVIELLKNLLSLLIRGTTTGYVGELSNFLLGCLFVIPAGLIYKSKKTQQAAVLAALVGALVMGLGSFFTNYYLVYPIYYNFMPKEAILQAYQAIFPGVKSIAQCLWVFNVPFTFIKGMLSTVVLAVVYKPLKPVIKARVY